MLCTIIEVSIQKNINKKNGKGREREENTMLFTSYTGVLHNQNTWYQISVVCRLIKDLIGIKR